MSSLGHSLEAASPSSVQADTQSFISTITSSSDVVSINKRSITYSNISGFVIIQSIILGCLIVGITVFMAMRQRKRARDNKDIEQICRPNLNRERYVPARRDPITSHVRMQSSGTSRHRDEENIKSPAIVVSDAGGRPHATSTLHSPGFYGSVTTKFNSCISRDSSMIGLTPPPKRAMLQTAHSYEASPEPAKDDGTARLLSPQQTQSLAWPPTPSLDDFSTARKAPATPIKTTYITLPSPSYLGHGMAMKDHLPTNLAPNHQTPKAAAPPPLAKSALLTPNWYQNAPLSARSVRSTFTTDTRLSIRSPSAESMMFASALRPAPPPRRLTTVLSEDVE
ncbi:hypothetical protein BD289DRAFT_249626 [Coniella lustricola]|uniref:Uncharacterized protein n=1 Tax=Coniella lustricola TaxID=2025994 RepID=A0A2T3A8P1_9PEZI|nr:hypothetical protein BD289DRAFT_249626 [Coniella lustricola]